MAKTQAATAIVSSASNTAGSTTRGRERWIALKREIGMLSRLTSGRR